MVQISGNSLKNKNVGFNSANAIMITAQNVKGITSDLPTHAKSMLRMLIHLKVGALSVQLPNGKLYCFDSGTKGPNADVILHNWNPPKQALIGGSIGVAESYIEGDWDSSDVTAFLKLFSLNYDLGNKLTTPAWLTNLVERIRHWTNKNTRSGSKRNISAHYDLGNDFYRLWLDKSMTYSSAIFTPKTNSLEAAQEEKYRNLAKGFSVSDNDHILEIGCGWGGFAEYIGKHTDARLTGLTISREQLDFAQKRIFEAGLNERIDLKFQDYRDEKGTYDKVASIEMFEAVGEKYWQGFFSKINDCLEIGGKAGMQIITIADKSYKSYRSRPDFIQRYVFPGGMLPSPTILSNLISDAGFKEDAPFIFPQDYARTLKEWRLAFWDKWDHISTMGFDDRFKRLWEFYLHYCEAGFSTKNTDVRQVFFTKSS